MSTLAVQLNNLLNSPMYDSSGKMTFAWAKFFQGLAGPTTVTIPLAKITGGGTNGSISLNDYGVVTEYELPT